jgi:hypothetical protein
MLPAYERLYGGRAYLPKSESEPVRQTVRDLVRRYDVADRRPIRLAPPPDPEQLAFPLAPGELVERAVQESSANHRTT